MIQSIPVTPRTAPPAADANDRQAHVACQDFSFYYNDNQAVKDVTLDFPSYQVTAIIGPSGCGKSTLLRSINRMNDLIPGSRTSGKMLFDGQEIYGPRLDVVTLRRRIGMVFQKPNPFPKSILNNIAYGRRLHDHLDKGELLATVESSLKRAGLWDEVKDRLEDNALSLSGGQQQRLCIARALAVDPEILLMDEPTSALDPRATARIEDLIAELRGRYTLIIVTHNMQQAARVSDFTAFLYEGNLVEYGQTARMFTKPREKKTEDYMTGRFG